MLKGKISPSLMCADFTDIKSTLDCFAESGIEYLHIDIMDGQFVPNITLSDCVVQSLRNYTRIPFDYHLMIDDPENKLDWFSFKDNDLVSVHYESTRHVQRALTKIRERGALAGLALNPATPLENLRYVLDDIDFLLIMTVNPGYAGQKIVRQTLQKIEDARTYLDGRGKSDVMIEVDGCVSIENAAIMRQKGADLFVAGTSSIFHKDKQMNEQIKKLREAIKDA